MVRFREVEVVPTGEYRAQIISIEEEAGKFGEQIKWQFELLNEQFPDKLLSGWCSTSDSVQSKFARWTVAAGGEVEVGADLDTNDLIGREVRLVLLVKTRDDGSEYNKVEDVKPTKKATADKPLPPDGVPICAVCGNPVPPGRASYCREHFGGNISCVPCEKAQAEAQPKEGIGDVSY